MSRKRWQSFVALWLIAAAFITSASAQDAGKNKSGPLSAVGIPPAEFMLLTRIPIVIYYGDFIPATPTANPGQDSWRVRLEMARKWRDAVNRRGGDVTVVHLPEVGIKGNTHFPFSDLNNLQIADLMPTWLTRKGLDKYSK